MWLSYSQDVSKYIGGCPKPENEEAFKIFDKMQDATESRYGNLSTNTETVLAAMYETVVEFDDKEPPKNA